MRTPDQFKLIYRDGAYYVSEPNVGDCYVAVEQWHRMSTLKGPATDYGRFEVWLSRADGSVILATWWSHEGDEGFILDDGHAMEWQALSDGVSAWVIQWADDARTKELPTAWMPVKPPHAHQIGEPLA